MAIPTANRGSELRGPAGILETIFERPRDGDVVGAAVVCHPHPLHGGTMTNKVAHTLARGFLGEQFCALRFNFRGVGKSDGAFNEGIGEVEDVLAAMDWLHDAQPGVPLWLAGFSFGAAMAINAAVRNTPAGLISIAPAVTRFADQLNEQPDCPWLILQGDRDELVNVDETVEFVNDLDPGPELQIFPQTEHFFHGKLVPLREAVQAFIAKHVSG